MRLWKSREAFLAILLSFFIRRLDVPSLTSRVSYYDPEECYGYIENNPYAEKPYLLPLLVGYLVSRKYFQVFVFICDLCCSLILNDVSYLLFSSFLFSDVSSLTNLLFLLQYQTERPKDRPVLSTAASTASSRNSAAKNPSAKIPQRSISRVFSQTVKLPYLKICAYFSSISHRELRPYFLSVCRLALNICLFEFTGTSFKPGVNTYWYINLQMIEQYRKMHAQLFFATHFLLYLLSFLAHTLSARVFLSMFFRESGYKGYLLLWKLIYLEKQKIPGYNAPLLDTLFNMFKHVAIMSFVLESVIWCMVALYGTGNMNFLCWTTLIFVSSSAAATLLLEIAKKRSDKLEIEETSKKNQ